MAFVVETGSVVANANSYVDVAFADDYHSDRGHDSWASFSQTKKEQALVRATDYVDKRYGKRFRGQRVRIGQAQPLEWPRFDVYDRDRNIIALSGEIPLQLKQAISEYALRAGLVGELAPDPIPFVPRQDLGVATPVIPTEYIGGQVRRVGKKVDVLEQTKSYQTPDQANSASRNRTPQSELVTEANIPEYPAADLILQPLLRLGDRRLRRA